MMRPNASKSTFLDEDIHVLGDRKRALCQALVNLVDNSLKYGKPRQTVTLRGESEVSGRNGAADG